MKNLQRGFIIPLLVVIVLLAIGGGFYVYKNKKVETLTTINTDTQQKKISSEDKTSGWKTYTNSQWGFSFKYPSSAKIKEKDFSFIPSYDVFLSVPFLNNNIAWIDKNLRFVIHDSASCERFVPQDVTTTTTINDITFFYDKENYSVPIALEGSLDEHYQLLSRVYYSHVGRHCYTIYESLSGRYEVIDPKIKEDVHYYDVFTSSEFLDLDKILATLKLEK